MRIGIIIPDRGDRPEFRRQCGEMLIDQTINKTNEHKIFFRFIDFKAEDESCDITKRYRIGYNAFRDSKVDVIALWENDDFYAPDYLETMINYWISNGKPDILGLNHTIYYHIKLFRYYTMNHLTRSSAMNTLIKPDLDFPWCPDHEAFTDVHLWHTLGKNAVIVKPEKTICMGIKHGVGLCGGRSHVDRFDRYTNDDSSKEYLMSVVGKENFDFYNKYFDSNL